ncbi:hypothetical protein TNCV_1464511 [Trichonephila clavipes]|nr:hypothetical protein TNCV_1464511 [Trichonephila clavipes]
MPNRFFLCVCVCVFIGHLPEDPTCAHFSEIQTIVLHAKLREHPIAVAMLSVITLRSSRINSSPADELILSQSQFQTVASFFINNFGTPCENFFRLYTALRDKHQVTFLHEYFFIQFLSPSKSGPKHSALLSYNHSAPSLFLKLHSVYV